MAGYRYYIFEPRAGSTVVDAARAAVSLPEMYWAVTGWARTQADADDRAGDGGIVVFAASRGMALARARDRLRLQFTAQARAIALADLDAGRTRPGAAAICRAMGLPGWAVRPALAAAISDAYYHALHERTRGASQP